MLHLLLKKIIKKTVDGTARISVSWKFWAKEKPQWISFKVLLILI